MVMMPKGPDALPIAGKTTALAGLAAKPSAAAPRASDAKLRDFDMKHSPTNKTATLKKYYYAINESNGEL
jgi:hypothetical protein